MASGKLTPSPKGAARWAEIEAALPRMLEELWSAPSAPRLKHTEIPTTAGMYLFSERGRPIYVGQTRNLRQRLSNHCRPSGSHNQASFAFLLAKKAFGNYAGTRSQLEAEAKFIPLFTKAKARVARMPVSFIECADPELRTVFEVYAAGHLNTKKYNSFETH